MRENRTVTSSQADRPDRQERSRETPRPASVSTLPPQFDEWQIELHGRRVIYRVAGSGPPVVLIHGMLNSSSHWRAVALSLAREHTVIAPDLIGHGDSAAPRGDYSLGAHASSIRDLLAAIGVDRASIVGHSLGGGVAMQFFYQFPQRIERLVLVSSGGLGHEVSPMLRTAALPGVSALLSMTIHPAPDRRADGRRAAPARARVRLGVYMQALARALRPLENGEARQAFLQTLRAVIDVHGQRVSATDRLYLLERMPTMIVWGERDHTIPLQHGREAHEAIPHSYFKTLPQAAHFPHLEDPDGLSDALREFFSRDPARQDRRRRLGRGAGAAFAAPARRRRGGVGLAVAARHSPVRYDASSPSKQSCPVWPASSDKGAEAFHASDRRSAGVWTSESDPPQANRSKHNAEHEHQPRRPHRAAHERPRPAHPALGEQRLPPADRGQRHGGATRRESGSRSRTSSTSPCSARPGENVAKYVYKGRPVAIDGRLDWRSWETPDGRNAQAVSVIANTVQFLGSPPSDSNGLADYGTGGLEGIAGGEEEALDIGDQEMIAAAAAAG